MEEHELHYGLELRRDVLLDVVADEGHATGPVLGLVACAKEGVLVIDAVVTFDVDVDVGVVSVSFFYYCCHFLSVFG